MTRPVLFLMFIFLVCGLLFYPLTAPKPAEKQAVVKTSDDQDLIKSMDDPDPKPPAWQAHEQWMKVEQQAADLKSSQGR